MGFFIFSNTFAIIEFDMHCRTCCHCLKDKLKVTISIAPSYDSTTQENYIVGLGINL